MTRTKITIDLSSSKEQQALKLPKSSSHNFKSTSLILDTFKNEQSGGSKSNVPQQLEALRKLYDDWQSDTEADKEVQSLMNKMNHEFDDDNNSVVSGSWSKMRAFKNMHQKNNLNLNSRARLEKGIFIS